MLIFLFLIGCLAQDEQDNASMKSIFGSWHCYERDGLAYPYTYEGDETQQIVDHDVRSVWQDIQLNVSENYTGELTSRIEITENSGAVESFVYSVPLLLYGQHPIYELVSDEERMQAESLEEETIQFECWLTKSLFLGCLYADPDGQYSQSNSISFKTME